MHLNGRFEPSFSFFFFILRSFHAGKKKIQTEQEQKQKQNRIAMMQLREEANNR